MHTDSNQMDKLPSKRLSGAKKWERRKNKGKLPTESGTNFSSRDHSRLAEGIRKRDRLKGSIPKEGKPQKRRATHIGILSYRAGAKELRFGIVPEDISRIQLGKIRLELWKR